jgi:hypothetical protein
MELRILTYIERVIFDFEESWTLNYLLDFKFGCDHVIRVLVENKLRDLRTNSGKQVQRNCTKI